MFYEFVMNTRQLYFIKLTSKTMKCYFLMLFILFSSACLDTSDITTPPKSQKDAAKSYDLNKQSPDFEITLLNGKQFKLSEHKGETILLNFWASYCKPCQWEMPAFEKIWLKYQNQNILIVGIALSDTKTNIDKFLEEVNVTYPIAIDDQHEIGDLFQITSLPTTIIINSEGIVTRRLGVANEAVLEIFLDGQKQ